MTKKKGEMKQKETINMCCKWETQIKMKNISINMLVIKLHVMDSIFQLKDDQVVFKTQISCY